ncbi:AAA family ATPase [Xenophilus sp. Marseille-Q4582]|uniref:AAA family ATPase n=1 Tax=Xenophilus sp. Marseille-Q4582 TaxID=2866600 RepID=UPI001CE4B1E7|nr:AAA family ATPase [Xenophilus sp. Marseille-Q4582]
MSVESVESIRRIFNIFESSEGAIRPHFMLTGPSGSGKSHTIQALADELELPYFDVNAASLTKEGISGNSLSKALTPLLQAGGSPCICFVDEFDKLFISGNNNSDLAHESTNGVQNEFLKVLEGSASVFGDYGKYIPVKTDKVLFIFAGAFNGEENIDIDRLREMGVKTEFLGRVGLAFGMSKPTLGDLQKILDNSPLLHDYLALFKDVKKKTVTDKVMEVVKQNYDKNTLGVRLVNTLIHQYFIQGGLKEKQVKKTTFQRTLSLTTA